MALVAAGGLGACGQPGGEAPPAANEELAAVEQAVEGQRPPRPRLVGVPGRVLRVNERWWALVPEGEPGTRYAPQPPLDAELQIDGLPVVFGGEVAAVPPGVRMFGTPLLSATVRRR